MSNPSSPLLIGWSTRDVTPDRPVSLRGQFHVRVSEKVNDPLTVTALAIEAGGEQAVMVSCDRAAVSYDLHRELREVLRERVPGLDGRKVFLFATHTHTAPVFLEGKFPPQAPEVMTPTESRERFVASAAEAVAEAWEGRKPGGVSWAFSQAVVGHNRRAVYFDGSGKMYGHTDVEDFDCIEGYEDHSVDLLFAWDEKGDLSGIVINLACPSQVTEGARYVSADFWHEARTEIRRRYGDDVFILPQCAPAGDQSPHFLLYKREEENMRERRGLTEREVIGRKIARAVDDVFEVAKADVRTELPFAHIVRDIRLPMQRITEQDADEVRAEIAKLDDDAVSGDMPPDRRFTRRNWYQGALDRYEQTRNDPWFPVELHAVRLGDVAIATNPFELFLDYGLRMKARGPALQSFLIQLSGGPGGYLPTAKAVAAKSYSAVPASLRVGPEGGQELVNLTLAALGELWRDEP